MKVCFFGGREGLHCRKRLQASSKVALTDMKSHMRTMWTGCFWFRDLGASYLFSKCFFRESTYHGIKGNLVTGCALHFEMSNQNRPTRGCLLCPKRGGVGREKESEEEKSGKKEKERRRAKGAGEGGGRRGWAKGVDEGGGGGAESSRKIWQKQKTRKAPEEKKRVNWDKVIEMMKPSERPQRKKENRRQRTFFCCVHFLLFLLVSRRPEPTVRITDSIPLKWASDVLMRTERSKQQRRISMPPEPERPRRPAWPTGLYSLRVQGQIPPAACVGRLRASLPRDFPGHRHGASAGLPQG